MTRSLYLAALSAAVVGLAGCSSMEVMSDWDREVVFSKYRTYKWAPTQISETHAGGTHVSLLDKRIRSAVDRGLAERGYDLREEGPADLLLVYRAKAWDKFDVYDYGYRYWGGRSVHRYREGTLALLMVDPKMDDQVVWQGWAVGVVQNRPEESEQRINEAVARMLDRFPPPQ